MRPTRIPQKLTRIYYAAFVSIILFVIGVFSGILFQKYYSIGKLLEALEVRDKALSSSPVQRTEVPVNSVHAQRVMVALVFGQSNSANSGETRYKSRQRVYNFYKGKIYAAQDPLLGAGGDGGSVWTRLGDELIEKNYYDSIVFVPLGVGSTEIARWKSDGDLHVAILQAIRDVKAQGLAITHLLWHQGESDAGKTSSAAYKSMFLDMLSSIRSHGVDAPIFVSVATRCQKGRPDKLIRQAQQELVNPSQGIYAGPDTDKLGFGHRYDGCHFSDEGLGMHAQLWVEKLKPK
jgi:hypothetical protein